jgi:hypothetical protein
MRLSIGDVVVRGHSWNYGDVDGGAGYFGSVIAVRDWQGSANAAVGVVWKETGVEGTYRYGFEGAYDVKVFRGPQKRADPLIIPSNRVRISLVLPDAPLAKGITEENGAIDPSAVYGFKCVVYPKYSPLTVSELPHFKEHYNRLCAEYSAGGLLHDEALVHYVNSISLERKLTAKQLLRCNWDVSHDTPSLHVDHSLLILCTSPLFFLVSIAFRCLGKDLAPKSQSALDSYPYLKVTSPTPLSHTSLSYLSHTCSLSRSLTL